MLTRQELFDTVAVHLLTQKQKSTASGGQCLYRHPHGLKCAIGCLIPDDKYSHRFEGTPVDLESPEARQLRTICGVGDDDITLAGSLQIIHDKMDIDEWRKALLRLAQQAQLSTAVIDQFPEVA